jgi:transketolase
MAQPQSRHGSNIDLPRIAAGLRGEVVRMSHVAKTPHLASCLSCIDILTAAYWDVLRIDPGAPTAQERDRFILSKGHAAMALYATLAHAGFFPMSELATYNTAGGRLAEHPGPGCAPGVEAATGSLGHGLGLGIGMALGGRIRKQQFRVFVLLSDGECNEGSVWEGALFAPAQRLGNLCAIVDFNKWQATGRSQEVMSLDPLVDKWRAFGWDAVETDGHDIAGLIKLMSEVSPSNEKPKAIIAHTVKGKGVSFMEDDNNWHYRTPTADEVTAAFAELGLS